MRRPYCTMLVLLTCCPVALALFAGAFAAPAAAQQPAPARIDSIFARYDRDDSPGCALGVLQGGRTVYQRGYGSANLDYGIRNGSNMVYYVGSVSKQFTAAAIALLAQEGKLSLDDDVRRYIPEMPDYGEPITIRQLIHHTSGLRDVYTLMGIAGIRMEDVMTDQQALELIAKQTSLNYAPGTEYLYTNSGYFLLGQIVKRVSGQSLREYAAAKIFGPLGMNDTRFHDQPWKPIRNRAISYGGRDGDYRITYLANFDKTGAGGLYTTLGDLAKWDANFYEPKVGGAALLKTLHTRAVLDNGDTLTYAGGLIIGELRGLPAVRHSGALMGFRAEFVRFPTERTSVIALCNHGSIDPAPFANRVAELYLENRMRPAPAAAPAPGSAAAAAAKPGVAAPTAAELAAYVGAFRSEELGVVYRVTQSGDTLLLTRPLYGTAPLQPVGKNRFSAGNTGHVLRFERDAAGRVTRVILEAGRVHLPFGPVFG